MTEQTELDRFLAAWASDVRLPAAELDSIRRRILAEPRPGQAGGGIADAPTGRPASLPSAGSQGNLPANWWQTFTLQIADIVVGAQRSPVRVNRPLVVLG